ncbi:probable cyclin-dependent serine/threonine-protein kinase DDB_G0292550 [Helicoverpa zea]|uniref:probable cyclin-dependent serine/threonine-protein kinase DDB_G0292550 n=1 Tax=Helicoverpa zea TaxID=7113 RepID=UPI001F57AFD9|nr:probable cyclin-dependent serine/threonine-protein kinase DDB_G0292550 [Helicoverpa zea]
MEKFEIKTATSLIPVMDGSESTTEKIIDAVELYSDCLKDTDQKKLLISFVLKTRLTKTAKLKLKSEYGDVASLLQDIKTYLLTKKSANAILCQLNNLNQNNMSVCEYGNKLSELFIDLTIAQASGNEKTCEILRPINEKLAIKRFSDGLRNKRLSTIISARNFSELKDAVRAAEDEELGQPSTSGVIFSARGKSNNRYNNNFTKRGHNNYYNRGFHYRTNHNRGQGYNNNYQQFNGNPRGGYTRGRGNTFSKFVNNHNSSGYYRSRGTRGRNNQQRIFSAEGSENRQTNNEETETKNQFFRS